MHVPETMRIGATTYRVERRDEIRVGDVDECFGSCDYAARTIAIRSDLIGDHLAATFWHELLHAIADDRAVALTEADVETLANGIAAMIRDNGLRVIGTP